MWDGDGEQRVGGTGGGQWVGGRGGGGGGRREGFN